jgi:hypothetical protein
MHEAWPKTHHRAPPDLAIRQRQLCSGARPSAQPLGRSSRPDRNRFRSLQGRVTTATPVPGELDFMDGGMTRRMKAHVSTMLTESGLSIPLRLRLFKGLVRRNGGCKTTSTRYTGFFGWTTRSGLLQWERVRVEGQSRNTIGRWCALAEVLVAHTRACFDRTNTKWNCAIRNSCAGVG